MTSVSSYKLYQCVDCGQKHLLPIYGTINFTMGRPGYLDIKNEDLRVCQRCESTKAVKDFVYLGTLKKTSRDRSSKLTKFFRRHFVKGYKEPELPPADLYPYLEDAPFNPDTYYSDWLKKNMIPSDYPNWFEELEQIYRNKTKEV